MALSVSDLDNLFREVPPATIRAIDTVNGLQRPNEAQLAYKVRTHLTHKMLTRLEMNSEEGFQRSLNAYLTLRRQYPDVLFHRTSYMRLCPTVSDTALFLVDQVIRRWQTTDSREILQTVCFLLQNKLGDSWLLEQYLLLYRIRTTRDILHAIDVYHILRQVCPENSFEREDLVKEWEPVLSAFHPAA